MSERDEDKPFTVSDRRHFTPEGRPRDEQDPETDVPPVAPEQPPTGSRPSTSVGEPGSEPADAANRARTRPAAGPADFGEFLLSLGAQAAMLVSEAGKPQGERRTEILDGVRSIVSILEMLQQKTEGRRTSEEERILQGLLFQLRMAYVDATRSGRP